MPTYKIINRKKYWLVKTADLLLSALSSIGLLPATKYDDLDAVRSEIKKILLIRLAYIGDVILTQPALKPLKQFFPQAEFHFLTSRAAAELLCSDPDIFQTIAFDAPWFYSPGDDSKAMYKKIRDISFDLGIDFRGDVRNIYHCLWKPSLPRRVSYSSGGGYALLTTPVEWKRLKHKVEFHLDLLRNIGIHAEYSDPVIYLNEDETADARRILTESGCNPNEYPVAIHPGARLPLKRWPVESFVNLSKQLKADGVGPIVLICSHEQADISNDIYKGGAIDINLSGKLTLRQVAAILSQCRCLICHDSAAMHIAAAVKTPVIALFGPSRPAETSPCGINHQIVEGLCSVKDLCDEQYCRVKPEGQCMRSIDVEMVIKACRRVLLKTETDH
ncbi:glycosyltransferase family 9 protein [bacterium]|nr:glycosyltransferase family 9 protein [candidate division CSSED10-310 bacterium]